MTTTLNRLLAGTLPDADAAGTLTVPVRSVVIGHDLAAAAASLVAPLGAGERVAVIHDPDTRAAMGAAVAAALSSQHELTEVLLPAGPQPDADTVAHVRAAAAGATMLVAVGSGTINDLAKYAAHSDGKPYVVFGTAPSMNGYTSVSAAITEHGHKKSLPASAARGVFLDLDVLAAAPPRLIAAGFGDSICRPTAQADWLLSHLLLGTAYRETPFRLLAEDEPALIASATGLRTGDRTALELLARTLVLSGFGMTLCGGSYPASQGEHLISHYLDMLGDPAWPTSFHGEHIAVTTLTMARLQTLLLSRAEPPTLRPTDDTETAFVDHFGAELGAECWSAFAPKRLDADTTAALTDRLQTRWPEIRARIGAVMQPATALDAALSNLAAPRTPEALGIPRPFYRQAVQHARQIRDRFTMLDFAALAGLLPAFAADA